MVEKICKTLVVSPAPLGYIEFTSEPSGAEIWIDGVFTGQYTPATVSVSPDVEHTWELKLEGYKTEKGTIVVSAGETKSISVTFKKAPPINTAMLLAMGGAAALLLMMRPRRE